MSYSLPSARPHLRVALRWARGEKSTIWGPQVPLCHHIALVEWLRGRFGRKVPLSRWWNERSLVHNYTVMIQRSKRYCFHMARLEWRVRSKRSMSKLQSQPKRRVTWTNPCLIHCRWVSALNAFSLRVVRFYTVLCAGRAMRLQFIFRIITSYNSLT